MLAITLTVYVSLLPGFHHSFAVSLLLLRKFRERRKNYVKNAVAVSTCHCAVTAIP